MATLYETLGVHEHATDEEIKRAYRKAAMRCSSGPQRRPRRQRARRVPGDQGGVRNPVRPGAAPGLRFDLRRRDASLRRAQAAGRSRGSGARSCGSRGGEAEYAQRVALAMRFATQGYNRDVVFGVLLGQQCDALDRRSDRRQRDRAARVTASGTREGCGSGRKRRSLCREGEPLASKEA